MADYRLQVSPSDPQTRLFQKIADLDSRLARMESAPGVKIIDTQVLRGGDESYSGAISVAYYMDRGPAGDKMHLTYTPTVDVWWEVHALIGVVLKNDAAYHYCYGQLLCTPSDALGVGSTQSLSMQHNSVNTYEHRYMSAIFALTANTTYDAQMWLSPAGGSWAYYRGPSQLMMYGKAWTR